MRRNTGEKQYFTEIDGLCFLAIFPVLIQHLSERIIRYFSGYFATAIDQGQVDFTVRRGTVGLSACFFILLEKLFMINGIVRKIKIKWKQWTNVKGVNTNKGAFFPLLKIKYLLIPLACFSGHLNVLSGQTATNNFDHKNIELEMYKTNGLKSKQNNNKSRKKNGWIRFRLAVLLYLVQVRFTILGQMVKTQLT
jgi:hypothetical protein